MTAPENADFAEERFGVGADSDSAIDRLVIDPDGSPQFVLVIGRKGTGKSHALRGYGSSWPYDAIVVDPTKDLDPGNAWTRPWPGGDTWPEYDENDEVPHRRYRITPDRLHDPEHRAKVDKVIELAHENPEPTMIMIDEGRYLFASDEKILPGSDVVQNEGRHGQDFLFVANPRIVGIRPVIRHQADILMVFDIPDGEDVKVIAGIAGMKVDELEQIIKNLEREERGPRGEVVTGFLWIEKTRRSVTVFPILPA